jgi:HTH-type transcriptional regulator, transcriptional repressor of NAD biosynthesis genes
VDSDVRRTNAKKLISKKNMDRTHGLTLGKFAPFHQGHQFLIETALAEVDRLTVIIYDAPETTQIPLFTRADWIRRLYPQIHVIEAWNGPTEVGETPEIKKRHEDYVIEELKATNVTHFYSSEFYGQHMSLALGAKNRIVDRSRTTIPVSATMIREKPYHYRHYLHPIVYRDLITKVVLIGAPSTGKTTLARKLAEEYDTVWMPEYGREYWEKNHVQRRLSQEQLVEIAERHLEREEELISESNRYLFVDTNAITTFMFALYYHQAASERLMDLASQAQSRYDLVFLCDNDISFEDSWDRSGEVNQKVFQKQIIGDLLSRRIPFITLRGGLESRVEKIKSVLSKFQKNRSLPDSLMDL